jgi:hypothetical protein
MKQVVVDALRVLFFRATREELARLGWKHLLFGLVCTWIVGMGRWWDDPRATFWQQTGLGSIAYVFVLSFVLWLFALPVSERDPSYSRLLTFVTLTAPPALLYALPVERWVDIGTARAWNVWFLGVVAAWRVALYLSYLVRALGLKLHLAACTALLPIAIVIAVLTFLNLHHATFDVMGGLRDSENPHDSAYAVMILISMASVFGWPLLLGAWITGIVFHRRGLREARAAERETQR